MPDRNTSVFVGTLGIYLCMVLGGCAHSDQAAGNPPLALRDVRETLLDSKSARLALAAYIEAHHSAFASPGRVESADELMKEKFAVTTKGGLLIGLFDVDLDKRTYHLVHRYGKPGEGWFEHWV